MIEQISNATMVLMDALLGWTLSLPLWVALTIVAVLSAAILTFIRPVLTNQGMLHRCKADKKRLGELTRQAKAAGDKDAQARYRTTNGKIAMRSMRAEVLPLVISVIPLLLLGLWAFSRLVYLPPHEGQVIEVQATLSTSAIDSVVYMLPQEDGAITAENGWVQPVVDVKGPDITKDGKTVPGPSVAGRGVWKLRVKQREKPYTLTIRCNNETCRKELIVDGRRYAPVSEDYTPQNQTLQSVQLNLPQYKPFGIVPGLPLLDPWLVGYLIICVPLAFAFRWMFNIC